MRKEIKILDKIRRIEKLIPEKYQKKLEWFNSQFNHLNLAIFAMTFAFATYGYATVLQKVAWEKRWYFHLGYLFVIYGAARMAFISGPDFGQVFSRIKTFGTEDMTAKKLRERMRNETE